MNKLYFSKEAEKLFSKLNSINQKKVSKAIEKLEKSPLVGEKLKGEYQGLLKLYAWPYRVIYSFDNKNKIILIVSIGHRQGVYKN